MYGSDCADCGVRAPYTRTPTSLKVTPEPTFAWTPAPVTDSPTTKTTVPSSAPSRLRTSAPIGAGDPKGTSTKGTNQPSKYPTRFPTKHKKM